MRGGYPDDWYTRIRPAVLRRDKYVCRRCGARSGQYKFSFLSNRVYVVNLYVAHLDHDKENKGVRLSRLLTMCQTCHVVYDNATDLERGKKVQKGRQKKRINRLNRENSKIIKAYYWGEPDVNPV